MDFKELREQLTDEQIKDILGQFNVEPFSENETSIINGHVLSHKDNKGQK